MPSSVTDETTEEQKAEISKLMLAAGIGIDVMYNYLESGADVTFLENVLSSRFNFAPSKTLYKSYMSDEDWNRTIVNELDNGRIILYRGASDDNTSNHLFIIDGYSSDNLYHVNWGWDGDMNCYVNIGNITVGDYDFSKQHMMVTGIEPNTSDIRYSSFMVNDGVGRFDYLTNVGFNFSSDHIETNVPFHAVYPIVYGNPDNLGFVTLALTNESDEIVEIISPYGVDIENKNHDSTLGLEGVYLFECNGYKLNKYGYIYCVPQLVVKSEIKPGYKLQFVGRDTPDSKWEFIASSNLISTTVELDKPLRSEWVDVKFEYDENFIELRSLGYFNTHDKALMDAVCRWELVYGGGGKIVFDESSTLKYLPYSDNECTVGIAQTITKDVNYFAKVEYIPDRKIYIESDITSNQTIVDGIVYEIDADGLNGSEPYSSAKIIGYTYECPDIVKFAENVEIAGKQYPIKYVTTGTFAGNKNIKHLNIQSDLYFFEGALSHMSGLESISVNTNKSPNGGRFLLHKSNKVENIYEKANGQHSTAGFQFNEFLNQLAYSEWLKYGVSPDWYIQDPETLVIEDHVCIKESDNPPHFYVPGQSVNKSNDYQKNVEISEMWSYKINRKDKMLEIRSNYPESIEIIGVLIDGKPVDNLSGKYPYKSDTSLDVVLEYIVNGIQPMTTHYTPEYNQTLPSSVVMVSSIFLNPSSVTAREGEQIQITATILPEYANNKDINWSSSDERVATVDNTGLITLITTGQVIITATTTDDWGVSAECAVVVTTSTGIDDVLADNNTYVRIFNLQGGLIYEGIYSDARLAPDYYIVVCDDKSLKVKVE